MITLRPYQAKKIADAIRFIKKGFNILFEEPTGSGKTLQIVVAIRLLLGKVFTHTIIAAPQKQIEQGFIGDRSIRWADGTTVQVPDDFIRTAGGRSKSIAEYLADENPGYVLSCTHAALTSLLRRADLPEDLTGYCLVIDESHHAAADGLSAVVTEWNSRGGRLMYATATPYGRSDGRDPVFDGMKRLRRSQAEHMEEGYAPRNLENGIVTFGHGKVTAKEFTGEDVTSDLKQQRELARKMFSQWVEDGRPKLIIRIPPMTGGCRLLIKILKKEFKSARIGDLTGVGKGRQQACLRLLESERPLDFKASNYDVLIGSMRVMEGTDWPVCSHVYCLGIPGSIGAVVQLIGRATRLKEVAHPSRNVAKVVFFVPGGDGDRLADLDIQHSRHALLVAAHMADHETASRWTLVKSLRVGLNGLADPEDHLDIDAQGRAEIQLHMLDFMGRNPKATVEEVVAAVARAMPEACREDIEQVTVEMLVGDKVIGTRAQTMLESCVKKQVEITPDIPAALKAAFAAFVEEFRDDTLSPGGSLAMQIHKMTGGLMREFAKRLASRAATPLTIDWIVSKMREVQAATGHLPVVSGELVPGTLDRWYDIHYALKYGRRGLPGGSSLFKLKQDVFGVKRQPLGGFSVEELNAWITAWEAAHDCLPDQRSGEIPESRGETWMRVDQALKAGRVAGIDRQSLSVYLYNTFDKPAMERYKLTEAKIVEWAREFFLEHDDLPNKNSGDIPGTSGETWCAVSRACYLGLRGLTTRRRLRDIIHSNFRQITGDPDPDLFQFKHIKPPAKAPKKPQLTGAERLSREEVRRQLATYGFK